MNVHVSAALINRNGRLLAARRADGVQVVVSGSEQGDRVYVLGFDGSAEESEGTRR